MYILSFLKSLLRIVLKDDRSSRLHECADIFGVPVNANETFSPSKNLIPVMPIGLKSLSAIEDLFDPSLFDPVKKYKRQ